MSSNKANKICNAINNMVFMSSGYVDLNAIVYGISGFVAGVLSSVITCNIML